MYQKGLYLIILIGCIQSSVWAQKKSPAQRADSLIKLMTLDEKVGQLHQLSSDFAKGRYEGAK
jgi:hypothetical protein